MKNCLWSASVSLNIFFPSHGTAAHRVHLIQSPEDNPMLFSKFRSWNTFKSPTWRKTPCLKKKLRRNPKLEILEDRTVPSVTLGVSVNGIDGAHSSCGCLPPDGAE